MITIPTHFHKNGFNYTLVSKGERSCVYAQNGIPNKTFYEVISIRIAPEKNINGKIIPKREVYPKNQDWGVFGWTYRTIEDAQKKFNELENNKKNENGN